MTENEANQEAAKRERNKSKHLSHKVWRAAFTEEKGWHVILADSPHHILSEGKKQARDIFFGGGTVGEFHELAGRMLLAQCQIVTDQFEMENKHDG